MIRCPSCNADCQIVSAAVVDGSRDHTEWRLLGSCGHRFWAVTYDISGASFTLFRSVRGRRVRLRWWHLRKTEA